MVKSLAMHQIYYPLVSDYNSMSRDRNNSLSQLNHIVPVPILLNNNESIDKTNNKNKVHLSHISNVIVGDYHIIQGEVGKSFTMWSIKIILDDLDYASILVYKRYSEIEEFRMQLLKQFSEYSSNIPGLPPKDSFSLDRFFMSKKWLEDRRKGLQWFLSNVLLNLRFQNQEVVKRFIL